jgi:hypothetical protein
MDNAFLKFQITKSSIISESAFGEKESTNAKCQKCSLVKFYFIFLVFPF